MPLVISQEGAPEAVVYNETYPAVVELANVGEEPEPPLSDTVIVRPVTPLAELFVQLKVNILIREVVIVENVTAERHHTFDDCLVPLDVLVVVEVATT